MRTIVYNWLEPVNDLGTLIPVVYSRSTLSFSLRDEKEIFWVANVVSVTLDINEGAYVELGNRCESIVKNWST